jgi:hypothetical protein
MYTSSVISDAQDTAATDTATTAANAILRRRDAIMSVGWLVIEWRRLDAW